MRIPTLRPWAFLAAEILCFAAGVVLLVRLALDGPGLLLGSMLTGVISALLILAGVHPIASRQDRQSRRI